MRVTENECKLGWLNYLDVIIFHEGEDDKGGAGGDAGGSDAGDDDDDDDDSGDKSGGADDKGDKGGKGDQPDEKNIDGLKSSLEKERKDRKALEKEAKLLRKFKEETENKDKSEADKAKDEAAKSTERVAKLAAKLKTSALESAIAKAAQKANFRDVDDALGLVKRDSITVEQDEDEPEKIEVDEKSVEKAVEALAKAKPHLLVAEGDRQPSGGKFGGKGKKDQEATEEAYRKKYPALRRGSIDR